MANNKNSEVLNTVTKNGVTKSGIATTSLSASTATAVTETVDIHSYITQKSIFDRESKKTTEFAVFKNLPQKEQDWIIKGKLIDIFKRFNGNALTYELKKTRNGNVDEGQRSEDGKAIKFITEGDIVKVLVYTQKPHTKNWDIKHTYKIPKNLFDAYSVVIQNDEAVKLAEHEQKVAEASNLNLDESNELS